MCVCGRCGRYYCGTGLWQRVLSSGRVVTWRVWRVPRHFTHTTLSHATLPSQIFNVQHCHTQLTTPPHTPLSHTTLPHASLAYTQKSFTHELVSQTAVSHMQNFAPTLSSHKMFVHTKCAIQIFDTNLKHILSHTKLFHTIRLPPSPFHHLPSFPAFPIPCSQLFCVYSQKLTCGVIRSFI